jgi:putative DNA-invertase from lambdoid prophage Rac
MKQALRAGLYARVSTADQQTLPMQISAMREYAERRGWTVVTTVQDINGGTKQRPKREELIKLARQRKLDVIIVWRLDRWGRSLSDLTQSLEELRALKVHFVSVTEGLDFTTPIGRAMAGMLGIFAEFERDVLRERVKAGMEHARAKGKVLGRPTTARDKADEIQQLLDEGLSKKEIANRLGVGRASVYRALEHAASNFPSWR